MPLPLIYPDPACGLIVVIERIPASNRADFAPPEDLPMVQSWGWTTTHGQGWGTAVPIRFAYIHSPKKC